MTENIHCPKCNSDITYPEGNKMVCTQCFHEWSEKDEAEAKAKAGGTAGESNADKVLDSNGQELHDGDTVVVIKDLPVKGASKSVKSGTKVKNIRLVDGDHNIACKIDGFGSMNLKSEFVRKG